jgi:two-component system, cell cycle sensor histidine kinase and response regulator CckA
MPSSIRNRSVRVLLVDAHAPGAARTGALLAAAGHVPEHAASFAEAREAAARGTAAVILAAQALHPHTGLELLGALGGPACAVPFILLLAAPDAEADLRASELGADDCLVGTELTAARLERSIRFALARREARDATRLHARELHAVAENAADVIQRFGPDLRHLYANPAVERFSGVPRERVVGQTTRALGAPDEVAERWDDALRRVFASGREEEIELGLPVRGGATLWMHTRLVPEPGLDGSTATVLAISRDVTPSHAAQQRLIASEEYHRALVEHAADGVAVVDANDRVIDASISDPRLLEGDSGWHRGHHALDYVHPDDRERARGELASLRAHPGRVQQGEVRVRLPGGDERVLETVARNLLHHPAVRGIVVNFRDVTEQRRQTDALRASEARYRALVEALPDTLFVLDPDGCCVDFRARSELLAAPPERIRGARLRDLLPAAAAEPLMRALSAALRTGDVQTVEYQLQVPAGWRDFEARLSADGRGAVLALVRDVTVEKRTIEALRTSEEQFRTVVESLGEGLVVTGLQGEIVYANERMAQMCGYTPDEMEGRDTFELLLLPGEHAAARERLRRRVAGTADSVDAVLVRRDGSTVAAHVTGAPYRDGTGAVIGTIGVVKDVGEQRRAQDALRASEERLRLILAQVPALIWTTDAELRFTSSAGRGLRRLGLRPGEKSGTRVAELFGAGPEETPVAEHRRALAGEVVRYEMEWQGGVFSTVLEPFRDASGAVAGTLGVALDVTEQRRAERALRESERLLRATVGSAPMLLWTLDAEGRFTSSDGAALRNLGSRANQRQGESIFTAYAAYPELLDDTRRALAGEAVQSVREVAGRMYEARHTPVRDGDGRVTGVIGVALDVDDRYRAEQALRESERRFRSLIENASDVIAVVDAGAVATFASPSVERLLGIAREDVVGRRILDLVHPDELEHAVERLQATIGNEGTPEKAQFRVRHVDGGWRVVEVIGTSLLHDDAVRGVVLNIRDETERHVAQRALDESQEKLIQAQKMEAVGQLAGGVAHDFNNLLTAIRGNAELLMADMEPGSAPYEDVQEIRRAADRAAALTRQLLAFSRKQVLQPRVMDLNDTVAGVEKMLRRLIGEDVELATELQPALGHVRADPGQLEQVLLNLAVNARDAMPRGGRLVVRTADAVLGEADVRLYHYVVPGDYVLLSVADTGHGMDAQTAVRVFEPFFTTKPAGQGTGLGLSTVYGIVKQSGGYVWIDSAPGEGTTVRIYLPRVDRPVAGLPQPAPAAEPGAARETLLLVEDEAAVRKIALRALRRAGYRVLEAVDGEEALRVSAEYPGAIDLVITDVVMPRVGGRDLVRRLRVERPETRVLFISGYSEAAVAGNGVLEPGAWFMGKPFTPDVLLDKLRQVLDSPRADAG